MAKTYRKEPYQPRDANAQREHHEWRKKKRAIEDQVDQESIDIIKQYAKVYADVLKRLADE